MIYLLRTFGKDNKEAFKLGYTKDTNYKNRISAYEVHNPFIEIIHAIPEATEIHEKKLHFKFRKYLLFKNEWFSCEDEIVDYLKSVTLEELNNLPELELNDVTVKKYRETIRLSYDRLVVSNRITIKEDLDKFTELKERLLLKLTYSRVKDYSLSDIFDKFKLKQEEIDLIKKIINRDYSDLPTNIEEFLLILINEGNFVRKMKLLCNSDFKGEELDYILKQLPSEFSKYYYTLGPEKIKARAFNRSYLEKDYSKLMFNESNLVDDICTYFKEGDKLSTAEIIDKLTLIYERHNNPSRPKAIDLREYFEITKTRKTVLIDGVKKVKDAFKLIKKLK